MTDLVQILEQTPGVLEVRPDVHGLRMTLAQHESPAREAILWVVLFCTAALITTQWPIAIAALGIVASYALTWPPDTSLELVVGTAGIELHGAALGERYARRVPWDQLDSVELQGSPPRLTIRSLDARLTLQVPIRRTHLQWIRDLVEAARTTPEALPAPPPELLEMRARQVPAKRQPNTPPAADEEPR